MNFIAELFDFDFNKEENFPKTYDIENIILRIKQRFDMYQFNEIKINDYTTENLSKKIDYDMANEDFAIKDIFKKTIFTAYYMLKDIENEDEWMELKWYVTNLLTGYCPCVYRFFYELQF